MEPHDVIAKSPTLEEIATSTHRDSDTCVGPAHQAAGCWETCKVSANGSMVRLNPIMSGGCCQGLLRLARHIGKVREGPIRSRSTSIGKGVAERRNDKLQHIDI